jgi:predicted O-methyltransferase YrrM
VRLFFRIKAFLTYWLLAIDKHSLQSPFVYDLYTKVIRPDKKKPPHELEQLRHQLQKDTTPLVIKDLGAGSSVTKSKIRTVGHVVRHSLSSRKVSAFLAHLVAYMECKHILELGTSIGLNTLYLASYPAAKVTTFEGCPETAGYASKLFGTQSGQNIRLIKGNIDHSLPTFLEQSERPDLVYIDANHTEEATLRYFEWLLKRSHDKTILVFDDIHWSPAMQKAWNQIIAHPVVTISLDLYHIGIVFVNPEFAKKHFILWW